MPSQAQVNFERHIAKNPYPGRGIVLGSGSDGQPRIVYWIMGRSANSRNRRFVVEGGTLTTVPADPSKVEDPSLILYEAMLELPGIQLVSNGDQTRTLADALKVGGSFDDALGTRVHEPDAPNFTPRISGMLDFRAGAPRMLLSKLVASPFDSEQSDRTTFRPSWPSPGCGYALTTYASDGNPLPSFQGDPLLLPLPGDADASLKLYWNGLNADNRISVAIKELNPDGTLRSLLVKNRF